MVPGILLALDNCLLNGIKKQLMWGIRENEDCKILILAMLGLGRQTTKILPCPLLVGIGKKSVSGPEDDF